MTSLTDSVTLSVLDKSEAALASPHDTATNDLFNVLEDEELLDPFNPVSNDGIVHFTHDDTVKGDDPEGSDEVMGADRYDPREITRAILGNVSTFE